MKQKIIKWMTPFVFFALIFGFATINILTPNRKNSESENRPLQQKPKFSWSALMEGSYTSDVEAYLMDQFFARDQFIGIKTQTEYLTGKRDSNGVYFAKDGYLIEKHTPSSLDIKQIQKNINCLSDFVNLQAKSLGNSHIRVMIVPTAGEILKDKLPAFAPEFNQSDLFSEIRKNIPSECFVELEKPLLFHKNEYMYYKTDHHWTTDAAYFGYSAYCNSIGAAPRKQSDFTIVPVSNSFYGTIYSKARLFRTKPDTVTAYYPKTEESYQIDYNQGKKQTNSMYEKSWLTKKDKYSYFFDGNHAVVKISGENHNKKHLLLIQDSYARCMAPFLARDYETITMIDLRYFNSSLNELLSKNRITDVLVLYNAVTFTDNLGLLKLNQ